MSDFSSHRLRIWFVRRLAPARMSCSVAAMLAVMVAASWLTLLANSSEDDSVLEIDAKYLQLGTVWAQDRLPWRVVIRNTSGRPADVKLISGCTCAEVQPSSFTIQAGEEREVTLFIDTRPLSVDDFGRPTFRMSVPLTAWFKTESDSGTRNWKVAGVVRQAILTSTTELRIPERFVAQHANPFLGVLEVSAMETMGAERIKATTSSKWLRADMERLDGQRWRLRLATTDAAPEGKVEEAVYLHAETAKEDSIPPLRIDVKGELRSWLRALPRKVHMGVVYAGEDRSADLQLMTVQSAPFAIQKIVVPDSCRVETIVDEPSKKLLRIRCTAAVEGNVAVEGTLDVVATVDTPSGRKVVCRVSVPVTACLVGKKE